MHLHHSEKKFSDDRHLVNVQFRGNIEWKVLCYDLIDEMRYRPKGKRKVFRFCIPANSGWIRGKPDLVSASSLKEKLENWGAGNLFPEVIQLINTKITEEA